MKIDNLNYVDFFFTNIWVLDSKPPKWYGYGFDRNLLKVSNTYYVAFNIGVVIYNVDLW